MKEKNCIILMYHALYDNEAELAALPSDEQPYAVSTKTFKTHLQLIRSLNLPVLNPFTLEHESGSNHGIIITFDDGHSSFHRLALPILQAFQMSACFFITPQLIEDRNDFCTWPEIKQLSDAGMLIGAHGQTHSFFSEMGLEQQREELTASKQKIEAILGREITTLSFPGGRYTKETLMEAGKVGYNLCFGSEIGCETAQSIRNSSLIHLSSHRAIKRIAIRSSTDLKSMREILTLNRAWYFKSKSIDYAKQAIKHLLSDRGYHHLYTIKAALGTWKEKIIHYI